MFHAGTSFSMDSAEPAAPQAPAPSPVPFLFNLFLRYTPFNLCPLKIKNHLLEKWLRLVYFLVAITILLIPVVIYALSDSQPFTLQWLIDSILLCWSLEGLLAGFQLTRWIYKRLESNVHERTRKFSVVKKDDPASRFRVFRLRFLIFVLMILAIGLSFTATPILNTKTNGWCPRVGLGILCLSLAVLLVAISFYGYFCEYLDEKWTSFNHEMREAAANEHFKHADLLGTMSVRHAQLLALFEEISTQSATFITSTLILMAISTVLGFYSIFKHFPSLSLLQWLILGAWTSLSIIIFMYFFISKQKIVVKAKETESILVMETSIWLERQEAVARVASGILARAKHYSKLTSSWHSGNGDLASIILIVFIGSAYLLANHRFGHGFFEFFAKKTTI